MSRIYPSLIYKLAVIYFEWSQRRGVLALKGEDGLDYELRESLEALLKSLKEPTLLIGEMTFDSFNLERRRATILLAHELGHMILCVPTRQTTKARYRAGFGEKSPDTLQSDIEDAQAIRHEAQHRGALRAPSAACTDQEYLSAYRAVKKELMLLRSTGEYTARPRSEGFTFHSRKEALPKELELSLPDINALPEYARKALGSSERRANGQHKGYNPTALAAVAVLAKHCSSRRMFDRVSGMHVQAYGSQVRSDLMFWVWAGGGKRGKIYTRNDPEMTPENYGTRKDGLTLTGYRNAVRWLYREIRNLLDAGQVKY